MKLPFKEILSLIAFAFAFVSMGGQSCENIDEIESMPATARRGLRTFTYTAECDIGNYDVIFEFGDENEATESWVKFEGRRLALEKIVTVPGEKKRAIFTARVKGPIAKKDEPTQEAPFPRKLNLTVISTQKHVAKPRIVPNPNARVIYLCGDSTVTDQQAEPWGSWGECLPAFFREGTAVANFARSGLTTQSFLDQGRLDRILTYLKKGDVVLVQFGHNDQKNAKLRAFEGYAERLNLYIDEIVAKGAIPVIVSPMERLRFDEKTLLQQEKTLADYAAAAKNVATRRGVAFIDLNDASYKLYGAMGPEESKKLFCTYSIEEQLRDFYSCPPDSVNGKPLRNLKDKTHHSMFGAYVLANFIVDQLPRVFPELAGARREESRILDVSRPPVDPCIPPSGFVDTTRPEGDAAIGIDQAAYSRPVPSEALMARLKNGPEIIGIIHFGLNTYTDREWGYGDAEPALFSPEKFDAREIAKICKVGGIGGLVVVAKHHDGFCLWPTKTTGYNISKSPFRQGKGDYVRELSEACKEEGIKFGVYISPWDRNNADYANEKYVEIYHAQIKELLGGEYGEIFEMWFDGANGGTGWYGGANERRHIPKDYYRFGEIFRFVRSLQPDITIFDGGRDDSDFRWPGNERGLLDPDSRATTLSPSEEGYRRQLNTGTPEGRSFLVCEADFPLRQGWFYHESERGTTKSAAYLAKLYLSSVGNGGTMNIGIAPDKLGEIAPEDKRALEGFKILLDALFSKETTGTNAPFNVVVLEEDISAGEQVDEWAIVAEGKEILSGKAIGRKRIRLLKNPVDAKSVELVVKKHAGDFRGVAFRRYMANPALVAEILGSSTNSGETDTAKWMTSEE